jgi:hypothetical protein
MRKKVTVKTRVVMGLSGITVSLAVLAFGHSLLKLINDILDLSKVASGRLEIEKTRTEPHRVISDVLQVMNIKAHEKGLALRFEARGKLPQWITLIRPASARSFRTWWATPSSSPKKAKSAWSAGPIPTCLSAFLAVGFPYKMEAIGLTMFH